jgi:hypothetical protein
MAGRNPAWRRLGELRTVLFIAAVGLAAAACSGYGTPATTPITTEAAVTTSSSTASTTTTAFLITETTSTTAVRTPSTEAWGTWSLILASIEVGETGAEDRAQGIAAEVDGAAVLYSSDYPSLNPGYWLVYWGAFESGSEASLSCSDQPEELTCYPRYLGSDISPLAADNHVLVIDGEALVIVDVTAGERLKVFDPYFSGDGMWVGSMSLTPDGAVLYYDIGWEDSWYACDSSQGQVERLDLAVGTAAAVAPGFAPAVSPDGHWLAVLLSEQCLPDPEEPDMWVLTPTDTVVVYDLTSGWPVETKRWSVGSAPTSYDDPHMVTWADWRTDSNTLLVMTNDGSIFEVTLDHQGALDERPPVIDDIEGFPQALLGDTLYITRDETPEEWGGFDLVAIDLTTGVEGEVITQTVGWAYAAADTTRTRLIWGSDTQLGTAETRFGLENYLGGFAW